jgi:hypothetical protein
MSPRAKRATLIAKYQIATRIEALQSWESQRAAEARAKARARKGKRHA